jgi:chemotaxis-related protein WspD
MSHPAPVTGIDDCWNRIGVWSRAAPRCSRLTQVDHCQRCPVYADAAARLRDREPPAAYAETWQRHYAEASPPRASAQNAIGLLVFRLGEERLALPLEVVDEVIEPVAMHGLSRDMGGLVRGLVGVHGRLRPCLDLAALLEIAADAVGSTASRGVYPRMVVLRRPPLVCVFPVDEVLGIARFDPRDLAPLPGTLARALKRFSLGLVDSGADRTGLLDGDLLFSVLSGRAPA